MNKLNLKTRLCISLASLFFFLILLEGGLRLGGYVYLHQLLSEGQNKLTDNTPNTILTLGDSYTVGGSGKWEENYPSQLQKLFSKNYPQEYTVINGGICEANSTQALSYLSKLIKTYSVDTVILLVGSANRFNPAGYHQNKGGNILSHLRLFKVASILMVNLKGRILQKQAQKSAKERLKAKYDYAYNKTGDFTGKVDFCDKNLEEKYQKEIISNPDRIETYYQLAECYNEQGKYEEAESLYNKMITNNIGTENAYMALGENYQKQGRYNDAEDLYHKLITDQPYRIWAYVRLAKSYIMRERFEEAEKLFKKALEFNTAQDLIYDAMASYNEKLGRYKEAATWYKKSLELNPKPYTYTELAWIYMQLGQFDEAVGMFINVIGLYPGEFDNYYALLKAYEFQSQYDADDIMAFFSKLEKENPTLRENEEFRNYVFFFKNRVQMEKEIDAWLENDLERIVQLCRMNNINLIIQNYPYAYHSANKVLENVANKNGVSFVDNYAVFNKFPPQEKDKFFSDFDHCTKEGHRIMADDIYKVLVKERAVNL